MEIDARLSEAVGDGYHLGLGIGRVGINTAPGVQSFYN
jgi:hypothetical protein